MIDTKTLIKLKNISDMYKMSYDPEITALNFGYKVKFNSYKKDVSKYVAGYILEDEIHINCDLDGLDQIFTIAHELSFSILNFDKNRVFNRNLLSNLFSNNQSQEDYQATIFSLFLLITDDDIKNVFDWIYTDNALGIGTNYKSYSKALRVKEYILMKRIELYERLK